MFTLAEDAYVRALLAGLDEYPAYYAHMGPANLAGPGGADLSLPEQAPPDEIRRRIAAGEWVVDLRDRVAFASGFVPGTVCFPLDGSFASYLGWVPFSDLPGRVADIPEGDLGVLPDRLPRRGGRIHPGRRRPSGDQHRR